MKYELYVSIYLWSEKIDKKPFFIQSLQFYNFEERKIDAKFRLQLYYQGPPNSQQHWYKISGGLFILLSSSSPSPFFVTLVGHFFWHFSYVKVSYCGKSFFVRTLFCYYFDLSVLLEFCCPFFYSGFKKFLKLLRKVVSAVDEILILFWTVYEPYQFR